MQEYVSIVCVIYYFSKPSNVNIHTVYVCNVSMLLVKKKVTRYVLLCILVVLVHCTWCGVLLSCTVELATVDD